VWAPGARGARGPGRLEHAHQLTPRRKIGASALRKNHAEQHLEKEPAVPNVMFEKGSVESTHKVPTSH
jgi:hypothetical protein